jgi:hypothetical protein
VIIHVDEKTGDVTADGKPLYGYADSVKILNVVEAGQNRLDREEKAKALMAEYLGSGEHGWLDFSDVHLHLDHESAEATLNGKSVSYENLARIFLALAEDCDDAAEFIAADKRIESGEDTLVGGEELEKILATIRG